MSLRTALSAALLLMAALGATAIDGCTRRSGTLIPAQRGEVLYPLTVPLVTAPTPSGPDPSGQRSPAARGLIEARVLHRSYPSGYHPKRSSHLMLSMPWMAGHIDDLQAYLNAAGDQDRSKRQTAGVEVPEPN
jgi:hypothetical protein